MTKEIYETFKQWANSDFLEVGEPRKKAYSKDELLLVEMGWKYGYDAGRAVEQALDKKAENARELGLDYEPVATLFGSLPVYDIPPPAQPAPVQPVAYWIPKAEQFCIADPSGRPFAKAWEPLYTTPPEAPVQRCTSCDGTGDVHDQTGEWRGTCHCVKAAPVQDVSLIDEGKTAAQRQWVGLTEWEVIEMKAAIAGTLDVQFINFARAIEAKLRSKNENHDRHGP